MTAPNWRKDSEKCCGISFLLRNDFATLLYSRVFLLQTMPNLCREREARDIKMEANFATFQWWFGVAKIFRSPLGCLRNFADTIFLLRNASWRLLIAATDFGRYFPLDFCCLNPKILLVSHQLQDSLAFKLVKRENIYVIISFILCSYKYLSGACSQRGGSFVKFWESK